MADRDQTAEQTTPGTASQARERRAGSQTILAHHDNHGHSVAAWTLVSIALLGALVASIAVGTATRWLFFVGIAIVVVGCIVGKVLQAMGFGQKVYEDGASDPDRRQGVR